MRAFILFSVLFWFSSYIFSGGEVSTLKESPVEVTSVPAARAANTPLIANVPPGSSVVLNVNNSNNNNLNNQSNPTQHSNQVQNNSYIAVSKVYKDVTDRFDLYGKSLWQSIKTNKRKIFYWSLGLTYVGINLILKIVEYKLTDPTHWSNWKGHLTLDQLFSISHNDFSNELVREIQMRYLNPRAPADFITPFSKFMTKLEKEKNMIVLYEGICSVAKKMKISRVFFYDDKALATCQERLHRLSYIHSRFHAWMTDFNLGDFKKVLDNKFLRNQLKVYRHRSFDYSADRELEILDKALVFLEKILEFTINDSLFV